MVHTGSGVRRYKVLAQRRFQCGYEWQEVKQSDVLNPAPCGLETAGRAQPVTRSDGDLGDEKLQSSKGGEVPKEVGVGVGVDSVSSNAAAEEADSLPKDSNFFSSEGFDNSGAATQPVGAAEPSDLQGFQCNGAATKINLVGKDCISEGLRSCDRTVLGCRMGRKAVVPWRFQIRKTPEGDTLGSESDEQTELPAPMGTDGLKQCAPTLASHPSRVNVFAATRLKKKLSAVRNPPSVKVQKRRGPAPKKRKTNMNGPHKGMQKEEASLFRENVLTTLREFRVIYRKLLEEEEAKWRERGHGLRPDIAAFSIYKERLCVKYDDQRYVGSIPGVRIGDVFNSNMELAVVGIHRSQLLSVDSINKEDGACLAVSIVSYAQPSASNNNLDFLLHVGSMTAESDQNIGGTDLALKQSMDTGTLIRVIHAVVTKPDGHYRSKQLTSYVYGGLYFVEKFCREKVTQDQFVRTFHLRRVAGQQRIDISEILKTRNPEPFDGTFMRDISGGLEKMPISVINTISNEYPVAFQYISQVQYPLKYQTGPPLGCDCVGGCSLSKNCACAVKNGGMFPYSAIGLTEDRPLIYECGPSCKCPSTCHNRVSQHGLKFRLQVFKTKLKGWGVRCLDFIPSGSFVCEYVGELIEEQEAQERTSDEYLFAAGNNFYNVPRWEDACKKIPALKDGSGEGEETVFAVDTMNRGNFTRFINHSCTPNLFPQNVLYDHDNKRMPHIMFFASDDIPALRELSYDYNYVIDQVYDSNGNIKKKECFCGSIECTGRLY